MWTDAVDLRDFYATTLGQVAKRMIRRRIRPVWPDVSGLTVLGLGYSTPYLQPFRFEAERVMAAMPASQGVLHWPDDGPGLTTLVDEADLPFDDLSMDRVLMVHALEQADRVRPMMREVWRVMSGSGRLLIVVPNRRGLWSRFERTPFGQGSPYSPGQLSRLLRECMFTPVRSYAALYIPPIESRMLLTSAPAWERFGRYGLTTFAGVIVVEATKQIYVAQVEPKRRRRIYMPMPGLPRRVGPNSRDG